LGPIGHLRTYTRYLSPTLNFFSADAWTLVATVIRNMTLNWLVFVPLLMAVLMAPRLMLAIALQGDFHPAMVTPTLATPVLILSGVFLAIATLNTMRYLPGVGNENHTDRDFLVFCLLPLVLAVMTFLTYDSWFDPATVDATTPKYREMVLWVSGACAAGWLGYIAFWALGRARRPRRPIALSLAVILTGISAGSGAWILVNKVHFQNWTSYVTIGPVLLLLAFVSAGGIFTGFTSSTLGDDDREWLARAGAWILAFSVGWAGLFALV
jgi:hypothetical protein